MYAINNTESNVKRTLERIRSMFRLNRRLGSYLTSLEISFENRSVVLRGELPSDELRGELVPTIRQAGILCQVCNEVQVS
ncbi:hypothetical protein RMSM_05938 [Rhodopirellula maiorica SM1]|uniref:BON domain-containing protein n=1 Tax=Rhodopirellula maiorica SM1 TaxID=1265738 RepID=M5RP34_9BACT|nr:hypothetical protein [Rhodopirellula maiorica]EMI17147.1 hypothetical protein RMSM_05938 [Rhodopirellula maiorica SM1]